MKFNPTDKADSIIADIDFLLFGNSATLNTNFSLTDRTRNVNIMLDEVVSELYKADPNYQWDDTTNTDFPIATLTLTSGQDHYTMLDSASVIWKVRMKDEAGVLRTLTPRLKSEFSDSQLNSSGGSPVGYYKLGGAVFPVPTPNYGFSAGVELTFQRGANHFTIATTDTVPGFNTRFHQYLSVGSAHRYAVASGLVKKAKALSAMKEAIKADILEHYAKRSPDDRTRMRIKRNPIRSYGLSQFGIGNRFNS